MDATHHSSPGTTPQALPPPAVKGPWTSGSAHYSPALPWRHIPSSRAKKCLFAVWLLLMVGYFAWRIGFTLGREPGSYGILFLAAELWIFVTGIWYLLTVLSGRMEGAPPTPPAHAEVDILIATYNEDLSLLRKTVLAACGVTYPHRTWICDDGNRAAVKAMAEDLGVGYLTRDNNLHAKAGNLNAALRTVRGEFVVTLDADHLLCPEFLDRVLGHFQDPTVALVQIPQCYYNIDSFQHVVSRQELWHEAALFHHVLQPGSGVHNAAFYVGTGAVLRRSALDAVGGFATGTITEDIHTSMRLHAQGFRSVYVDEPLGFLLAADTPLAFALQRLRWAQGSMQVLRQQSPLHLPGLSLFQRLSYLNALTVYLAAFPRLLFYTAPSVHLLFGLTPFSEQLTRGGFKLLIPVVMSKLVIDLGVNRLIAGPLSRPLLTEVYNLFNVPLFITAAWTLLFPKERPFRVTPKELHAGLPLRVLVPVLALVLLNVAALAAPVSLALQGGLMLIEVLFSTLFSALYCLIAATLLLYAWERRAVEEDFSIPTCLPGLLTCGEGEAQEVQVQRLSSDVVYLSVAGCRSASSAGGCQREQDGGAVLSIEGAEGLASSLKLQLKACRPDPGGRCLLRCAVMSPSPGELDPFIVGEVLEEASHSFKPNTPLTRYPEAPRLGRLKPLF